MKITAVEIFDCDLNRKYPGILPFNPVFCRVHTDAGVSGVGEAGIGYGAGTRASVGMLRDLAPRLIGQDPMRVEAIWENLFRATFWGMSGGPIVYAAMSALDIALWDIRAKILGVPVYELLGGKTNESLRCYASQLQFGWDTESHAYTDPRDYARATRQAIDDGYDAVKVDPVMYSRDGKSLTLGGSGGQYFGLMRHDEIMMGRERLAAMREEAGPDVDIILEIHSLFGTNAAIQFARAVEDLNIFYYEEPTMPLNTDCFARVARESTLPVATGERSYTRWGYRELLEKQAVAVIQPDLCICGGITEGKKICDYANIYDATVQVHAAGGPVSTAAALQVEAAIPNFIIHEHHTTALNECVIELCVHNWQPEGGRFTVPDLPGIGQELNDKVVRDYLAHTIQ
ncbi:mandelate racemase/muconate lactonizing enzyme family protein [Desulfovibrio sp. OttesenSCG-928-I05]|nr:mandelate racemase/muconate lactonizing enzyme family protein [Desulfovibrio sp. OttesenSCG-928-I05]